MSSNHIVIDVHNSGPRSMVAHGALYSIGLDCAASQGRIL
jgi:hypothetical protein